LLLPARPSVLTPGADDSIICFNWLIDPRKAPIPTKTDTTKNRILDAAEELFAEQGIGATSLRSITGAAEVNPASIHYHFGGKQALLGAVIARRLDPLNQERLRRFDRLREESRDTIPSVQSVVDAYVAPALQLSDAPGSGGARFMRLLGRFYNEASDQALELLRRQLQPVVRRFAEALQAALPAIDQETLAWRVHFLVGAMSHTMACREQLGWLSEHADRNDVASAIDELVAFASGGLAAGNRPRGGGGS
jgi:AcrR family transcriptional regulator